MQAVNNRRMSALCRRGSHLHNSIYVAREVKIKILNLSFAVFNFFSSKERGYWSNMLSYCLFWSLRTKRSDCCKTVGIKQKFSLFCSQVHYVRICTCIYLKVSAGSSLTAPVINDYYGYRWIFLLLNYSQEKVIIYTLFTSC